MSARVKKIDPFRLGIPGTVAVGEVLDQHPVAGGDEEVAYEHEDGGEHHHVQQVEEDGIFADEAHGLVPFAVQEGEQAVTAGVEHGGEQGAREEEGDVGDDWEEVPRRELRGVEEGRLAAHAFAEEGGEEERGVGGRGVEIVKAGGGDYHRAADDGFCDGVPAADDVDERPDEDAGGEAMQHAESHSDADAEEAVRRVRHARIEHGDGCEDDASAHI